MLLELNIKVNMKNFTVWQSEYNFVVTIVDTFSTETFTSSILLSLDIDYAFWILITHLNIYYSF